MAECIFFPPNISTDAKLAVAIFRAKHSNSFWYFSLARPSRSSTGTQPQNFGKQNRKWSNINGKQFQQIKKIFHAVNFFNAPKIAFGLLKNFYRCEREKTPATRNCNTENGIDCNQFSQQSIWHRVFAIGCSTRGKTHQSVRRTRSY